MKPGVVLDTSALVPILFLEEGSESIGAVLGAHLDGRIGEVHVPDLAFLETAYVLMKHIHRGTTSWEKARAGFDRLREFPFVVHRDPPFDLSLLDEARRTSISPYDLVFVDLSRRLGLQLLTNDLVLLRKAQGICPVADVRHFATLL